MIKKILPLSLLSFLIFTISSFSTHAQIQGIWLTGNAESRVQISPCGDRLCGKIIWLREDATKGKVTKDRRNKDKSLKKRPILGINVLPAVFANGTNAWKGKAYNPDDGNTYSAKFKLKNKNTLEVSGCVLGGLICKKQIWYRLNPQNAGITGKWYVANGKSRINAYNCGNNLCAKVEWVAPGQPKSRMGKELLIDMAKTSKGWKGKALNPDNNKTYSSEITQISADTAKLRACLAGIACHNLFWHRAM